MKPRYYVVARDLAQFRAWVKDGKKDLQACKQLSVPVDFMGLDFSSPEKHLILLPGNSEGRDDFFRQLVAEATARFCRDRRIMGGMTS
jgi:hypothetical protein